MLFSSRHNPVINRNDYWYVETQYGYEGPFENKVQAQEYASLLEKADSARVEFAGINDGMSYS